MESINILPNVAAIITALFGVFALVKPTRFAKALHFKLNGSRGRSEMRTGFGGPTIAIAVYALISQHSVAFTVLGCFWFGAVVIRLLAMLIDRPAIDNRYIGYLVIELIVTALLFWQFL